MLNKINNFSEIKNQKTNNRLQIQSAVFIPSVDIQIRNKNFKSLYLPGGVSFMGGAGYINNKAIYQNFPNFGLYRSKLAEAIGTTADCLKSILEPEELKEILQKAKPENFSIGKNFENILNGTFNINLHIHSNFSDGTLSIEEILNQAAKYAEYRKNILHKIDPVIIAFTDHDMLAGPKEVVKLISKNSEKYKDIRVVLGIEANAKHDGSQLEAIGYCINPFDKKINEFFDSRTETNKQYLKSFIEEKINKWEKSAGISPEKITTLETVIKQARDKNVTCGPHVKYFGGPGLVQGFTEALKSIFYERGWKFEGIEKFAHEHDIKYGSFAINPGTPTVNEVAQVVKDSGSGFVGIAHPCRNLGRIDLRYLFQDFKKIGVDAAEVNYQYPHNETWFPKSFQEHADLAATQAGMSKTGGGDNHTDNVFTNEFSFKNLPEKIQKILLTIGTIT